MNFQGAREVAAAGLSKKDVAPPFSVGAGATVLGQWHMAVATSTGSNPRCSQVLSSLWNEWPEPRQTLAALGRVAFPPGAPLADEQGGVRLGVSVTQ